jgi:hypothetical protein
MSLLCVHGFLLIFVILTRNNMRIQIPTFFIVGKCIQKCGRMNVEAYSVQQF